MRIGVLAGGVGSARLLSGLVRVVDPADVTVVVNTGDDECIRGLHLSPDVDTVLYHLAGMQDWDRGWGIGSDTFAAQQRYSLLARSLPLEVDVQDWIALGDLDLATKLMRTRLLDTGLTQSEALDALRQAMGVATRVLPMTDDAVRTVLVTEEGEMAFQDWFVRARQAPAVRHIRYDGSGTSRPAPAVKETLERSDLLMIPPSNPLLSIGPALAVPGVREAIGARAGRCVAMSPIVGGRALKGPADRLLSALGHEVSPLGVARLYEGLVDVFVIDGRDAALRGPIEDLGVKVAVCDTLMPSPEGAARLVKEVLALAT